MWWQANFYVISITNIDTIHAYTYLYTMDGTTSKVNVKSSGVVPNTDRKILQCFKTYFFFQHYVSLFNPNQIISTIKPTHSLYFQSPTI